MSKCWYLVKRNWDSVALRSAHYAGVGGDVWPLEGLASACRVHSAMMESRTYVPIGNREEYLCVDQGVAEAYFDEVERRLGNAWLLMVNQDLESKIDAGGIDVGNASGGFSLVESELIVQGLPGPQLNEWGLFGGRSAVQAFLDGRDFVEGVEDLEGSELLAVRVLRWS